MGRTPLLSVGGIMPTTITFKVTLPTTGIYLFRVGNMCSSPDGVVPCEFDLLVETIE